MQTDLSRPLLSSATSPSNPRLARSVSLSTSAAKVSVASSDVSFTVRVPAISKPLALPTEEAELQRALDKQTTAESSLDVALSAKLSVRAAKPSAVFSTTTNMQYAFRQLIQEFESMDETPAGDKDAQRLILAQKFHEHVKQALSKGAFSRRESIVLQADFSSAEHLLEQGVEGYVRAVRRLLRTDLDDSVRVSFKNLNFVARSPVTGTEQAPYRTIGSTLYGVFITPIVFTLRTLRNIVSGAPAIEYRERHILSDMSGVIEPGRLTLVIGPPGCGKTTFLKALSAKLYQVGNPNAELLGELQFNQHDVAKLKNPAAWVTYVTQSDEHQALLTTRETLEFAFNCRKNARYEDDFLLNRVRRSGGGEEAVSRIKALAEIEVDVALAVLGLASCAETIIGNENLKGVSGGEKRRVTLGEMLVTGAQIMCCDEISTGLDSAATFDITSFLRSTAHVLNQVILVALLQPAPEVLDLFDDLIVLAEGRIIYHGPRDKVQAYFEGLGFRVPPHKDLSDFIVELPTRNGLEFQLHQDELRQLGLPRPPVTAQEFANRWKASVMFQNELKELARGPDSQPNNLLNHDDMPQHGFFTQLWLVIKWSWRLRMRALEQVIARLVANVVVGMFFGTLFFNLQLDDWWLKAMLMMMALMFLISIAFPNVQVTSQQKPIFFKHISAGFYSPLVFCLAQFIVGIPFIIFDVAVFASSLYWMCGLARHAINFLTFLAVCITFGMTSNTMMSMFPFVTPDQDSAIVLAALVLIILMIASGAVSTESMIPEVFRWMIWINPFAYAYRALAINEYHSGDYEQKPCKFEIVGIKLLIPDKCSDYFLSVREVRPEDYWIPAAILMQVVCTLTFLCVTVYAVAYVRFDVQRVGAVGAKSRQSGAKKKPPTPDELRQYEQDRYLDAVSPRNMQALASATPQSLAASSQQSRRDTLVTPQKTLVVRDLWYTIPINGEPIDFLKGVSFWAMPGRMTALMGSSGAGKTTLMDVIAGRKTVGYARGSIMVNGTPKVQSEFTKYTGYVEQFGVHAHAATVEESLMFSARLRLPRGTTETQRRNFVNDTLGLLELDDIKDALAGTCSMEQNKRLTLGVELVSNPSIIFCDEPTSGLDARAAAIVMRVLLRVARSGRTVVCTIHQPSSAVFAFFDDLLLLKRGGETVFFGELGEGAINLITHLEAIPGTKKFVPGTNPATFMLDCIGAGTGADAQAEARRVKVDYAHAYRGSALKRANDARLEADFAPIPAGFDPDPVKAAARASEEPLFVQGFFTQLFYLLERNWLTYWRSPEFSLNRVAVVMMFTILFGGFFFQSKMKTVSDVEGRIVLVFFFSSLSAMYSLYTLVPFAMARRALYYRERASYTYSVAAYTWAEGLVEVPYLALQVALTCPIIYLMTDLPHDRWERPFFFVLLISELLLLMTSLAFFVASMFSDPLAAQLAAVGLLLTLMVFCGIMVPLESLPKPYVPMYYLSFFKYSSEGLLTTQFYELDSNICVPGGKPALGGLIGHLHVCTYDGSSTISQISGVQVSAAEFVLDDFAKDYKFSNRWMDVLVLGVWIVGLRLVTYVITLYVNHQKR